MDTKFSIALHVLAYIEETNNTVTSELLAKSVGTNASHIRKLLDLRRGNPWLRTLGLSSGLH